MEPVVRMVGITKRFPAIVANDSVDFTLEAGQIHALVGENGAGKTTLMRVLYGQYAPDEGEIWVGGERRSYNVAGALALGIGMVHQNFMQIPEMSIVENIILGHTPKRLGFVNYRQARQRVQELLTRFGMKNSPDAPISSLCVGERQKIEIIKVLYLGARVLILDEPTAVLTPQETTELFGILRELKAEGTSVIFISHKLREVIEIADRITVMRKGRVAAGFDGGGVDETAVAQAMIGKQDVQLLQNDKAADIGAAVLEAKNLWCFDGDGVPKLRSLSLQVRAGEILGVAGVEGSGQTELAELLTGLKSPTSGSFTVLGEAGGGRTPKGLRDLGVSHIPEDRMLYGIAAEASVSENLAANRFDSPEIGSRRFLSLKKIRALAEKLIEAYTVKCKSPDVPVDMLSGGNIQKVVVARELSVGPKVLIANQPTRGVDVGAVEFIHRHLLDSRAAGCAILLISSDLNEVLGMSDRLLVMHQGRVTGCFTDVAALSEEELGLYMLGMKEQEGERADEAEKAGV